MGEIDKSYFENSTNWEKEPLIEKRVLQLSNDTYEYLYVSPWVALGTSIPPGETLEGISGPEIVISDQIQDLLDENPENGTAIAVILHEFGHRGCGHHTGSEGNSPEVYSQHEVEANTWAINLISQKYNHLAWAKSAKEYLLKRNELELHKPKDK